MSFLEDVERYEIFLKKKKKKTDDGMMSYPGDSEIGYSGLDISSGIINEEYNSELRSNSDRANFYTRMRYDASVDTALNLAELPILVANYNILPTGRDSVEMESAEFLRDIIYNRSNITTTYSYRDTLKEECKFMQYGFFPYEKVYDRRDWNGENFSRKNMIVLKKLALRHPKSVDRWKYKPDGSLEGMYQVPSTNIDSLGSDEIFIPVEKLLLLVHNRIGNNFEGISILRPLVKHWSYKNGLYKIEALGLQKNAMGIPSLGMSKPNSEKLNKAKKMLRSLMVHEEAGIIYDRDKQTFDYKQGGIHTVAIHRSISHHDSKIYQNVLAGFMLLGQESRGGARNLGGSLMDFYLMMSQNIVDLRCDIRNRYLLQPLVSYNYSNIKRFPKEVGNLNSMKDKVALSNILKTLADSNYIDPSELSMREYVHSLYGFPEPKKLSDEAQKKAVTETDKDASENKKEPANKAEMSLLKWLGRIKPLDNLPVDYRERWIKASRKIEELQRKEISESVSELVKMGQVPNINYIDVPYNDHLRKLMREYVNFHSELSKDDSYSDFVVESAIHTHNNEMKWEILDTLLNISRKL